MSSGDGGLGAMVLEWAKKKEERCEKWMDDLKENDIEDMDALVKVAASPDWEEFLGIFKIPLRTYMREWYERATDLEEVRTRKRKVDESKSFGEAFVRFAPFKKLKPAIEFASWPGTSDFREVRFSNIPYIDKTGIIYELTRRRHVFLSRPRRFGKTLLVNTLKQLYLGSKELFEGLEIDSKWDWNNNKYPVIYLDFSCDLPEHFGESLVTDLIRVGAEYGMSFDNVIRSSLGDVFKHLADTLRALNAAENRNASFVILIDEYDKPVIDCLDNSELVRKNLNLLSTFLQMVKSQMPVFSLVTGSSRLAHTSVFSGDNNRVDVSFDPSFNELCGFTEEEIIKNLGSVLDTLQLNELKDWFNGYRFGGNVGVYNPFSIASCCVSQKVDCYWVRSGTTKLLAQFCGKSAMKSFISDLILSDGIDADLNSLLQSQDISELGNSSNSLSYLFLQAGYLTIIHNPEDSMKYKLTIPNKEIKDYAFPELTIAGLIGQTIPQSHAHFIAFSEAIKSKSIDSVYDSLFNLFQVIGYPDRGRIDKCEDYYQRILQAFLLAVCPSVRVEERTSLGKSDVYADFGAWKVLFELKVLDGQKDTHMSDKRLAKSVMDAFDQVEGQYLAGLTPDVICIFVFNTTTRTLFARDTLHGLSLPYFKQYN